jgi:hypothetical protein
MGRVAKECLQTRDARSASNLAPLPVRRHNASHRMTKLTRWGSAGSCPTNCNPERNQAASLAAYRSRLVMTSSGQSSGTLLPRLEILPGIVRSPVDSCFGTSPSQAPKSRPCLKPAPLPIAATTALERIGPTPGTVIRRWQLSSCSTSASISAGTAAMRSSQVDNKANHSWRSGPVCELRISGSAFTSCRTMMPRSMRKPRI